MADSFPTSTSKLCWFSLSSLFFKTTSSAQDDPPAPQQITSSTPTSSPVRRRTSPRLSSSSISKKNTSAFSSAKDISQNHCCLLRSTSAEAANKNCNCAQRSSPPSTKRNSVKSRRQQQSSANGEKFVSEKEEEGKFLSSSLERNGHMCSQGRHIHHDDDKLSDEKRTTHGLSAKEAPSYLTFNPYITGGYRNSLHPLECLKSLFWWTNETLNIWSHLLGWVVFFSLSVYDTLGLSNLPKTQPWDQVIFSLLLVCFQACMILSAAYHVFCCCSEKSYRQWLTADLLGVSLSLLAIYISGIYYAFSCVPFWLNFYLSTVAAIFVCCLTCTFFRTSDGFSNRLLLFGGWACYGIVPTIHWAILHGGFSSTAVSLLLPRIFWMYAISAAAFFFYVSKLPERWKPGLVNYIGSSHQIWHVLIVAALYHWHNTGLMYLDYRSRHPCSEEYAALYSTSPEIA